MFKRLVYTILIALPLVVLMIFGSYIAYQSWLDYQRDSRLGKEITNIKLLQSAEHSFFNELVCISTLQKNPSAIEKVCSKMQDTTNAFLEKMTQSDFDSELYAFKNDIETIRAKIREGSSAPVTLLVSGEIDKSIHAYVQNYIGKIKHELPNSSDKERMDLYQHLNSISYASETEKAFVAYYLATHAPIPSEYLIFWDRLISEERFDLPKYLQYALYRDILMKEWESESVQAILRKIENIRFDLMSHASTGAYRSTLLEWISLSNAKHKILMQMEKKVIERLEKSIKERADQSFAEMLAAGAMALLSLIALMLMLRSVMQMHRDEKRFDQLTRKIQHLTKTTQKDLSDKEIAYNFIESSYETLHDRKEKLEEETRRKNRLFSGMFYKMQKPIDTLLGYSRLIKETPLTTEQSDFVDHIEESSQQLEQIIKEAPEKLEKGKVMEFEIRERAFDIIKKTESAVDVFATLAAQKDINLSLFTDPSLPEQLIGDDIRIFEVLNQLIDNAVADTHTYGDIDISLEKVLEDEKTAVVKFEVKNACMGYGEEELQILRERLNNMDGSFEFDTIKDQMLHISASILQQMGSRLEIESIKGENLSYAFTLRLPKVNDNTALPPVRFEGMKVGIALPSLDIHRQQEKNIESYIKAFGAECRLYDYDMLIHPTETLTLPDLMIVYHHYARLEGEIEMFMGLDCNVALVTTPTLRSRIDLNKYHFSSIVYNPVTYHKVLRMLAESKLGHTTFSIEDAMEKAQEENEKGKQKELFEGLRVLLAEDNEINQKLWKEKFASLGIEATVVSNGKEAFDKRRENDFDIIFMDIDMPLMDGFEATNKILYYERINQLSHIPIIALVNSVEDKERYLKLGMDEVYLKSSSDKALEKILEEFGIEMAMKRSETEEDELIAKVLSEDFIKL